MGLQDDCVLWNKLGSVAEVTNSEIGSDFVVNGNPTYLPTKFDNGVFSNNNANYPSIPVYPFANVNNCGNFIVDFWFKPSWGCVSGNPSDTHHVVFEFFIHHANNRLRWYFYKGAGFYFDIAYGGTAAFVGITDAALTWGAHELHHMILCHNRNGISGTGNTIRIYVDGAPAGSSNIAFGEIIGSGIFYLLRYNGGLPFNGLIDNIKIYNNCNDALIDAIIANRNTEGWPAAPPGGGKLIDGKMINPLIDGGLLIN